MESALVKPEFVILYITGTSRAEAPVLLYSSDSSDPKVSGFPAVGDTQVSSSACGPRERLPLLCSSRCSGLLVSEDGFVNLVTMICL